MSSLRNAEFAEAKYCRLGVSPFNLEMFSGKKNFVASSVNSHCELKMVELAVLGGLYRTLQKESMKISLNCAKHCLQHSVMFAFSKSELLNETLGTLCISSSSCDMG